MNFIFSFSSRETYLLEKRRWSTAYQEQVESIRAAKAALKNANRELEKSRTKIADVWAAQRNLAEVRSNVWKLLDTRAKMSQEAQKQYLAEKKVTTL